MLFQEGPGRDLYRQIVWGPWRSAMMRAPLGAELRASRALGRLAFSLLQSRRRQIDAAMRAAGAQTDSRTVRVSFETHFAHQYAGFMWHKINASSAKRVLRFVGREHLAVALSKGRGVIVAQPHMGLPQLPLHVLGAEGYPVHQVAGGPNAVAFSPGGGRAIRVRRQLESSLQAQLHDGRGFLRPLVRALQGGDIVFTACDGTGGGEELGRRSAEIVCGSPYQMPVLAEWLAERTGAPVVPCGTWWDTRGRLKTQFEAPLYTNITECLAEQLTCWLRGHPEAWHFWDQWHAGAGGLLTLAA
jgi:lauroyl/myristoyl acyltransferase